MTVPPAEQRQALPLALLDAPPTDVCESLMPCLVSSFLVVSAYEYGVGRRPAELERDGWSQARLFPARRLA